MVGVWPGLLSPTPAGCRKTKGYQHIPAAPTVSKKQMCDGWEDTVHTNVLMSPG